MPAFRLTLLCLLLALPPQAAAQGDPMEQQRCVWACLASSPGVESAEYPACVAARCTAAAAPATPQPAWTGGATADGRGRFAGVADPATGAVLYFLCGPGGRSFLSITGPEGPSATLTLDVDGQRFAIPFTAEGGAYYTPMPPGAPPLVALVTGRRAVILNAAGTPLVTVPLTAAMETIDRALMDCR